MKILGRQEYYSRIQFGPAENTVLATINSTSLGLYDIEQEYPARPTMNFKETIYSTDWYPGVSENCFLLSVKNRPLKLVNSSDFSTRYTYHTRNTQDEPIAPNAVKFSLDACQIYCGDRKSLFVFDVGGDLLAKFKVNGMVSDIDFNRDHSGLYCVGCYNGLVSLLDCRSQKLYYELNTLVGLTNSKFSQDGNYLVTCHRNSSQMLVWDIRNTGEVLHRLDSDSQTCQRLHANIYKDFVYRGDVHGNALAFEISTGRKVLEKVVATRPVCEVLLSNNLMLTSSGARKFGQRDLDDGMLILWDIPTK